MRLCGTPGCTKKDFHTGGHSFETEGRRDHNVCIPCPTQIQRPNNQFQRDISFAREAMKSQCGVVINLPKDIMGTVDRCNVTVLEPLYHGTHDVVSVTTEDGIQKNLKDTDLMRADVYLEWKPLDEKLISRHRNSLKGKAHEASDRRMDMFVKVIKDNCKLKSTHKIYSLDGDGCNIEAYRRNILDFTTSAPQFTVCDIDPVPALCLQLIYGRKAAFYTGAMFLERFGYGCSGTNRNMPPGIEYLITTRINTAGVLNTLITEADCENTIGFNFDLCGGIFGGLDFEAANRVFSNMIARLPHLMVLCVTFGKRQRSGLKYNFEKYATTPHGFCVAHTFDEPNDNQRVVSKIYTRIWSIPRLLNVPGNLWYYNKCKSLSTVQRLRSVRCVVKSIEGQNDKNNLLKYNLYCIDDDEDDQIISLSCANLDTFKIEDSNRIDYSYEYEYDVKILKNLKEQLQLQKDMIEKQIEYEILKTQPQLQTNMDMVQKQIEQTETSLNKDCVTSKKQTRKYLCRLCGKPKKGHVCSFQTQIMKRKYRCGICGQDKKGHICSFKKVKELLDAGILTQAEFDAQKKALLDA